MKISKLIIKNFRIFRGKYEFDFTNKDLIIIEGQNGNGKSTIFDAIEWCFTGEIQRYKGSREPLKFNYLLNDQEVQKIEAELYVEIHVTSNAENHTIIRSLRKSLNKPKGETKVKVNGREFDNLKSGNQRIQELLMRRSLVHKELDQQTFKEIFSSTQLLSQDELSNFILAKKPQDRFVIMESILGLNKYGDDFQDYLKRAAKRIEELKGKDNISLSGIEQIRINIEKKLFETHTKFENKQQYSKSIGQVTEQEIIEKLHRIYQQINLIKNNEIDYSNISSINITIQDHLIRLKKDNENDKMCLQEDLKNLQISKEIFNISVEEVNLDIEINLYKLAVLSKTLLKRKEGLQKAQHLKRKMENVKIYRIQYQEKIRQLTKVASEISFLQINKETILNQKQFAAMINDFSDASSFRTEYERRLTDSSYINQVNLINERIIMISALNTQLTDLKKQISERESSLVPLEKHFKKCEDMVKDLTEQQETKKNDAIAQMIYNVQQHLKKENKQSICPVCGTTFANEEELLKGITDQWDSASNIMKEFEKKSLMINEQKDQLERTLQANRNDLYKITKEFEIRFGELNELSMEVEKQKFTLPDFWKDKIGSNIEEIKQKNARFLESFKIVFEAIKVLQEVEFKIDKLNEKHSSLETEIDRFKTWSERYYRYLDLDEEAIQRKLLNLQGYSFKAESMIKDIDVEEKNIQSEISNYKIKLSDREKKLTKIKENFVEFTGNIDCLERLEKKVEFKISTLNDLDLQLKSILKNIEFILSQEELGKLKEEKVKFEKDIYEQVLLIEKYKTKISLLDQHADQVEIIKSEGKCIQSRLIGEFIEKYSDVINRLFFQISPHAWARYVYFIPREGNLYIVLSSDKENKTEFLALGDDELYKKINASLTLSSAQSNVLAICIFLALNTSQKWSKLEFIGIDDPFQNMDDINAFSFIDAISEMLPTKQMFISTHSEEFSSLIKNKSSLINNKVGYINLISYSRDKVAVSSPLLVNSSFL